MNIILDIILLVIVALSIWYGYKRGLIGSILSILAIIVALIAGSSLSANYAFEAVPVLEPFLNGYVDSQKTRDTVLEKMGYGNTDLSLDDVLASDSSLRYDYAVLCCVRPCSAPCPLVLPPFACRSWHPPGGTSEAPVRATFRDLCPPACQASMKPGPQRSSCHSPGPKCPVLGSGPLPGSFS